MEQSIIDRYEQWLRSWTSSESTVNARRWLAASRLNAWGGVEGFTAQAVREWFATGKDGGPFEQWTKATYHANLKDFATWLVLEGLLDHNPLDDVKLGRRPGSQPRPLSESEIARVLSRAEGDVLDWIRIALLSGLRAHEIAKLKGDDVSDAHIYVNGKGGKRATIPTHPDVYEIVQRIGHRGYLWPANNRYGHVTGNMISQRVARFFRSEGIEGSVHRCRHSYATNLLRKGVNLKVVQNLMRHSSLATTEAYLGLGSDEMRDAINLLSA